MPGAGGCRTLKVGKVKPVGRLPVVKVRGAEATPLFTLRMRYVVLGSMPATRTLVLFPGTMGCAEVLVHDGLASSGLNCTYIEVPEEGGALYRATRGFVVGLTTALFPTILVCTV